MTVTERTEHPVKGSKHRSEQNRLETNRVYAEIKEAEEKARLEKTKRLRRMWLFNAANDD